MSGAAGGRCCPLPKKEENCIFFFSKLPAGCIVQIDCLRRGESGGITMQYNFDEIIDRSGTNAVSEDGIRRAYFGNLPLELIRPKKDFIRMWIADMEFAVPDFILDAVRDRLDGKILGYTALYDDDYFNAFSNWVGIMSGWHFEREDLFISHGIVEALFSLVGFICRPGDKVLITTPSYRPFAASADCNGVGLVCSPLKNDSGYYTVDYADFAEKAADPAVKVCIFCNPHNPTGRVWKEEELRRVGEICLENGLFLISDEIHCDLLRPGIQHIPTASLFPESDRIITCMAPSKTFNIAGLQMSNIIIPNAALKECWKKKFESEVNPLSLAAATAAYTKGYDWLVKLRQYLDGNFAAMKGFLAQYLPKAVFRIPEATYLAWIDISAYVKPGTDIEKLFAEKTGVLLEAENSFVANADGHIRVNIACPRAVLIEALNRMKKLLVPETE